MRKWVENLLDHVRGHPDAGIADHYRDQDPTVSMFENVGEYGNLAAVREFYGVAYQVEENLANA